jgi:hypothetical protein
LTWCTYEHLGLSKTATYETLKTTAAVLEATSTETLRVNETCIYEGHAETKDVLAYWPMG